MAQERKSPSRVSAWIVLAIVSSLVIAIGCGGGGGGGTSTGTTATTSTATTSTATTSTATTSTATTSTATTSTATTATSTATTSTGTTSTGTVTGVLPTNVIVFSTSTVDNNNNLQTTVSYVNPDGTAPGNAGPVTVASFDSHVALVAQNPQKAGFVFAYTADPTNVVYDLYITSSASTTIATAGSTKLTNVGFSAIDSLQFSPDGSKIIFVASVGSDLTQSSLYLMNSDGTGLHTIDAADDAYLSADGVHIAYTKFDSVNGVGQINVANIDGTNLHAITSNTDDHFGVQLSKDGTRFAWSEAPPMGSYDIYTAAFDGSQLTKITSLNGDEALTPAFNSDGTAIAYVDNANDSTKSGVYSVGVNGLGTAPVTLQSAINSGLYWTSSSGLLSRYKTAPMFSHSIHIAKMKKLGKWHGGGR